MPQALDVLLPLPLPAFTFLPPLQGPEVRPGQRVVVPWQSGVRVGVVLAARTVDAGRGMELRHVLHALGPEQWLSGAALEAVQRIARATASAPGTVLATLNPPGLQPDLDHRVRLHEGAARALAAERLELPDELVRGEWAAAGVVPARALEFLRHQGLVDESADERPALRRTLVPLRPPDEGLEGARRAAQRRALDYLLELGTCESAAQLARDADVPAGAVRTLVTRGYAGYEELPAPPPPLPAPPVAEGRLPPPPADSPPVPAGDGALVGGTRLQRLAALAPLVKADVDGGTSVVVLAPDQALAARTASLLATELPVAYLTGEATDEQRLRLWRELGSIPQVLVGTYLALLAPLPKLGRVVVLDAGSSAYKLQSGARVLVPKAARLLAHSAQAALTLVDVCTGPDIAARVPAPDRARLPLPKVRLHVADLGGASDWPVHPDLMSTLKQVADRRRQAVVLAPRRGFSGAFGCLSCGWQAPCPNCDLTLRFHRQETRLLCHQCGHEESPAAVCPDCGSTELGALKGAGTQWIVSQLTKALPGIPVYRYDKDNRDDLSAMYDGEPGVVVGTVALLGLEPLPQLALVGITHFDTHLAAADYRAEEEATRTLLRLVELAGGARRPLVVVQTHAPEHELLQALGAGEPDAALEALLGRQLERRRRFGYPPFTTLAKLQLTARDRGSALAAAQHATDALMTAGAKPGEVLGPASAPVERVKGRFLFHVLLRAEDEVRLETLLGALPRSYPAAKLLVDVDPQDVGALLE